MFVIVVLIFRWCCLYLFLCFFWVVMFSCLSLMCWVCLYLYVLNHVVCQFVSCCYVCLLCLLFVVFYWPINQQGVYVLFLSCFVFVLRLFFSFVLCLVFVFVCWSIYFIYEFCFWNKRNNKNVVLLWLFVCLVSIF